MKKLFAFTFSFFAILISMVVLKAAYADDASDPDANYDRLDGTGASGKKAQVIEWEGNLEIHVYPKGSLRGLGLKLDLKNKSKPVMVISYRFDTTPTPLIRRAILGIDLHEGFKAYRDGSEDEFDKIVISNSRPAELVAYKLDPEPTQLYPDAKTAAELGGVAAPTPTRKPANAKAEKRHPAADNDSTDGSSDGTSAAAASDDDEGRIKPFFMRPPVGR